MTLANLLHDDKPIVVTVVLETSGLVTDPDISNTELETIFVKSFGDVGASTEQF